MKSNIRPLAIGLPILLAGVAALVVGCGGNDNPAAQPILAQAITAEQACDALTGRTIAGASVTAVAVAASGAVPTYCMASGTIAPSLNFQLRLPQKWNGKLHYGGGDYGYNGFIPALSGYNLAALNRCGSIPRRLRRSSELATSGSWDAKRRIPRPLGRGSLFVPKPLNFVQFRTVWWQEVNRQALHFQMFDDWLQCFGSMN